MPWHCVRHEYEDGTVSKRLVAAESRLALEKAMNNPRLELMGALAGLRVTLTICAALDGDSQKKKQHSGSTA